MPEPSLVPRSYGNLPTGSPVTAFTIDNGQGLVVQVMTYGATLMQVQWPGRDGQVANLVTTCERLEDWLKSGTFFGSTVGRFANRIARGRFQIDGTWYSLATNNGPNHLHGGPAGFDKQNWTVVETFQDRESAGVRLQYISPDGDEGYPGQLTTTATYRVGRDQSLTIDYTATTDKLTVVNLTNHAYWNLAGHRWGSVHQHRLQIQAQQFLEVDQGLIPSGRLVDVADTPLDFRQPTPIGQNLPQVKDTPANGFDHCFAVDGLVGQLRLAASVDDPQSGRAMEVWTTQPGVQLYTANHFDGSPATNDYPQFGAFCLETQGFPDAPNHPNFPSALLEPGQTYRQQTVHRFAHSNRPVGQ